MGKGKRVLIVALVGLLVAAGGVASWWMRLRAKP